MGTDAPLRVSVICTANRFRSPIVEAVLRGAWTGWQAQVDSFAAAGPSAMPAVSDVVRLMAERGHDLGTHTSRALEPGVLADRDLVVVFEASHAAAAVVEGGAPRERVFLIRELVDVLPPVFGTGGPRGVGEVRETIERIGRYRMGDFYDPQYQFGDPMAGPRRGFPAGVDALVDVGQRVAARLAGLPEPPEPKPAPRRRGLFRRR